MSEANLTFNRRAVRPMECLREGWQLIKGDYWHLLGITAGGVLLGSLVPFGILLGPVMCGIYLCLFRRQAGRPVSFEMLFEGFNYFGQSLIVILLMIVPMMLVLIPVYALFFVGMFGTIASLATQSQNQPLDLSVLWAFLALYGLLLVVLVPLSILIYVFFFFALPLVVDRKLSGFQATRLSFRAALGNFGGILGVVFLMWLMNLIGYLACCVGVYFVMPLTMAMVVVVYRQVFPVEGSVLFGQGPTEWPEPGERFGGAGRPNIQPSPDVPQSVTRPPDEPGIQRTDG